MFKRRISRRDFLKAAGLAGLGMTLTFCQRQPSGKKALGIMKEKGPLTVKLWHGETPPNRVKAFQEIIDTFNAQNPDIKVEQETFTWSEAYAKVVAAVNAGNQPDICFTIGSHLHAVRATGKIQPLTDLFNSLNPEIGFFEKTLAPFRFQGEVLAIPLFNLTHLLVYRQDLLEEIGFTKPPATWEEWLAAAKGLTKNGRYAITLPASKHLYTDQCVTDFMVTNKADIFSPEGEIIFNSPETVEVYNFYKEMYRFSPPDAPSMTWPEANSSFLTGQSAMTLIFGAIFARLPQESPDFVDHVKAAAVPWPPDGRRGVVGASNAAMVLAQEKDKIEASRKFIEYLAQPDVNVKMLSTMQPGLYNPVSAAAAKSPLFWDHPILKRFKSSMELAMELTKDSVNFGFNHKKPHPEIAAIAGQHLLAQVVQKICIDGVSPQEAVAWGHKKMLEAV